MKFKCLLIALLFIIVTSSCNFPGLSAKNRPTPPASPSTGKVGLNLLVSLSGDVQLKRSEWSGFSPTSLGALLYPGDQILPAKGAKAVILCEGLTQWSVPVGAPAGLANGCPATNNPVLLRGASHIGGTRGGSDPLIPYIISPRKTQLLSSTPILRWNAVPGATSYTISITTDKTIWQQTTDQTTFVYPGSPALKPGVTYLLELKADTGRTSRDEGAAGLGFNLMTPVEAGPVLESKNHPGSLNLSEEANALALAQLYQGYGLMAEAIEVLIPFAEKQVEISAVYRMLGDLYLQSGVNLLAESHYQRASELALAAKDIEGQAIALAGMGEAEAALGNNDAAIQQLSLAVDKYKLLGDQARVTELNNRIGQLK